MKVIDILTEVANQEVKLTTDLRVRVCDRNFTVRKVNAYAGSGYGAGNPYVEFLLEEDDVESLIQRRAESRLVQLATEIMKP